MKTNYSFKTLSIILFLFISNYLIAQNKCCSPTTTIPEVVAGVHGTSLLTNQNTLTPVLSINASADLPNVAYIVTKKNVLALNDQGQPDITGGGGNVVLGADEDGVFTPDSKSRYGIDFVAGDTLEITAVGYDLAMMQNLTDSLLNGASPGSGPCCGLFNVISIVISSPALAGFCDTLNQMNIYNGSDVTTFEDVLTVLTAFSMLEQLSVESIIYTLNLINNNGTFVSADCGGLGMNNYMPYGINATQRYAYEIASSPNTCCLNTTVAPELSTGIHGTLIAANGNTPVPVLDVNASVDLPNVEYVITKRNVAALNALGQPDTTKGGGDVVIGADEDGVFMPMDHSRYGVTLTVGDTFDITAMGYDLSAFKTLMDSLLNGTVNGQPCCDLFGILGIALSKPYLGGFCDSIHNAGILGAMDLNNMEEILPVFDAFNNSQTSLGSIVAALELLNDAGSYISSDCGGTGMNDFMPYGIHLKKQYAYVLDNPLIVRDLSSVSLFLVYPNPTKTGLLNVHFTSKQEVNLVIRLFDALGQEVRHQALNNVLGDFNTTISTQTLPIGVYYLELADGKNSKVHKVVVN
jgi:hypothetical protein